MPCAVNWMLWSGIVVYVVMSQFPYDSPCRINTLLFRSTPTIYSLLFAFIFFYPHNFNLFLSKHKILKIKEFHLKYLKFLEFKGVFGLHFHFLFSFSENCFHFQNIRILKICLVWLLVFCFQEIKTLKMYFQKEMYFYICLKLHSLPSHFHFTQNEVQNFNWKQDFIVSRFWFVWENIFTENVFKNPTKRIFITIFYFQWKWKHKIAKSNTP